MRNSDFGGPGDFRSLFIAALSTVHFFRKKPKGLFGNSPIHDGKADL